MIKNLKRGEIALKKKCKTDSNSHYRSSREKIINFYDSIENLDQIKKINYKINKQQNKNIILENFKINIDILSEMNFNCNY